jgi:hypothetical protein
MRMRLIRMRGRIRRGRDIRMRAHNALCNAGAFNTYAYNALCAHNVRYVYTYIQYKKD